MPAWITVKCDGREGVGSFAFSSWATRMLRADIVLVIDAPRRRRLIQLDASAAVHHP